MRIAELALIAVCITSFLFVIYFFIIRFDMIMGELREARRDVTRLNDRMEPEAHRIVMKEGSQDSRNSLKNYSWDITQPLGVK